MVQLCQGYAPRKLYGVYILTLTGLSGFAGLGLSFYQGYAPRILYEPYQGYRVRVKIYQGYS